MDAVTIIGAPASSYVWACRIVAAEKGVPFVVDAFGEFDFRSDAHFALHPWGRMPILRHGDLVLYETLAIFRYLDEAFEGPALQPDSVIERARMTQFLSAFIDYLYPAVVPSWVLHEVGVPGYPALNDTERAEAQARARRQLEHFETAYADREWLAGDAMSLADILMTPLLAYVARMTGGDEVLRGLDALGRMQQRMMSRDSVMANAPTA